LLGADGLSGIPRFCGAEEEDGPVKETPLVTESYQNTLTLFIRWQILYHYFMRNTVILVSLLLLSQPWYLMT